MRVTSKEQEETVQGVGVEAHNLIGEGGRICYEEVLHGSLSHVGNYIDFHLAGSVEKGLGHVNHSFSLLAKLMFVLHVENSLQPRVSLVCSACPAELFSH